MLDSRPPQARQVPLAFFEIEFLSLSGDVTLPLAHLRSKHCSRSPQPRGWHIYCLVYLRATTAAKVAANEASRMIMALNAAESAKQTLGSAVNSAVETVKNTVSAPAPPSDKYLRWDSPGVEDVKPNEQETAAKIGQVMNRMQEKNFAKHRHAFRATHVKVSGH